MSAFVDKPVFRAWQYPTPDYPLPRPANDTELTGGIRDHIGRISRHYRKIQYRNDDIALHRLMAVTANGVLDRYIRSMISPLLKRTNKEGQLECIRWILGTALLAWAWGKRGVHYSRSRDWYLPHVDRALPVGSYRQIVDAMEALASAGLIQNHIAPADKNGGGQRSWYRLAPEFAQWIDVNAGPQDVMVPTRDQRDQWEPVIIARKRQPDDSYLRLGIAPEKLELAKRMARELRGLNEAYRHIEIWLHSRDIAIDHGDGTVSYRNGDGSLCQIPHPIRVRFRRIFNSCDISEGGRIYAAFQNLPASIRQRVTVIAPGGPASCAEVDIVACHLTLAYERAGHPAPPDPYRLISEEDMPRSLQKRILTILMGAGNMHEAMGAIENLLKEEYGMSRGEAAEEAARLKRLLDDAHPKIAHLFGMSQGIKFQRIEGDGLIRVMIRLVRDGIYPLPLHDAILVPPQHIERTMQIVREEFSEYAPKGGVQLKAKQEHRQEGRRGGEPREAGRPPYSRYSSTELISNRSSLHIVGPTHEHQTGPPIVDVG